MRRERQPRNSQKTLRTTLPPHHLIEHTEMRRESQSDIKSSSSSPQESNSRIPSPRMNRGDRSELACTECATRGSYTPTTGPSRTEGEENPREAPIASRDLPKASRPSEGRERYEGKLREARLPKKSTKGHRSSGSKVSEQS